MKLRLMASIGFALTSAFVSGGAVGQESTEEITVVLKEALDGADPCSMTPAIYGNVLRQNVIETLTVLDPADSTVLPKLATSWEALEDGVWRFHLREGVTFHDGAVFNADAVVKSFARTMTPELTCLDRGNSQLDGLTVTAVDEYTVDLKPEPNRVLFPVILSYLGISSPNTDATQLVREPVGTGPYAFTSWDPNKEIVLDRYADYWEDEPQIDRVHYVWRSEPAIRAAMVEVGEADIALDIPPQDAVTPLDHSFLTGDTTFVRISNVAPLDDVRLRRALKLSIDRTPLIGTVLSADALMASQIILPKIKGYNDDLVPWEFDPEQAKALIEEARAAGVDVDAEIKLVGRSGFYANGEEILQAMAQMWRDVGFNVKLEMVDAGQWLKMVNKPYAENRPPVLLQEMHDNNRGDASFSMRNRFTTGGKSAEFSFPVYDDLVDKAEAAVGEEREALFEEANRMLAEEMIPGVPMFHMVSFIRVNDRLNVDMSGVYAGLLEISQITIN